MGIKQLDGQEIVAIFGLTLGLITLIWAAMLAFKTDKEETRIRKEKWKRRCRYLRDSGDKTGAALDEYSGLDRSEY